ncbi:serine/threonine protein kinase [uncultured Eubacterium sp.]|uniref:serine/threonine protein kinase n=1 Tax=uncultured Eubacterium sp. TaxID=165185 RepID=UPI002594D6BE|nr:serine/threonine protein kinase [uncultured Eubacterium sp.]
MDSILGRTILGYEVKEKIGTGGFGNVYRVERTNIVGNVNRALKVITLPEDNQYLEILNSMGGDYGKADQYLKTELDRVVNEIRVFSMISEKDNHHIVSYYENDIEKTEKYKYNIYILMELMMPLDKWLYENNITVSQAIDISLDVAKGIKICHDNNIVHRDIKLNNIFVSKDGKFKLGDFGISKKIGELTRSHTIKGTPHYIAPEIYVKNEKYSNSSDIYSLGILMYYLFNKRRYPFYPNYPEVYKREDEDRAFYERMQYEKLDYPICAPDSVAEIILKAMEKPGKRYKNISNLIADLEKAKADLDEKTLNIKVGFEPKTFDKGIENEADSPTEKELLEALERNIGKSISFQEHSIQKKVDINKTKTKKRIIFGIISLITVAIVLVFVFGMNNTKKVSDSNSDSKITTTYNQKITTTKETDEPTKLIEPTTYIQVIKVENYRNCKYSKVSRKIEKSGLVVKKKSAYSESVKKGLIISQSIASGTEVVKGTTIVLKVSKGSKKTTTSKNVVNETTGRSTNIPKTTGQSNPDKGKSNSSKKQFDFGEIVE